MDTYIYLFVLAIVVEILGTVGGFGSSLFFVPVASYFFDFHSVLGLTALFHVTSNLTKIAFFRKGVNKQLVIIMGIPAIVFVVAGAFFTKYLQSNYLEILLALFLIITSIIFLINKNISLKPTFANSFSGGALSGLIAGIIGTGGAIRGLVLAAFDLSPDVFIATSAIIDLGIDASRSVVYTMNGYVHKETLYLIPILFLASIIGTFAGKKIIAKISQQQFKFIVLLLILIMGLVTLGKVLSVYF